MYDIEKDVENVARVIYSIRPWKKTVYHPPVKTGDYGSIIAHEDINLTWEECLVDIDGRDYCILCTKQAVAALNASTAVQELKALNHVLVGAQEEAAIADYKLKELQERYDALVKENEWQPIETAPKDVVIITCGDVPKFARISYFDTSSNQWNYYPYGSGKHKVEPPYWWRELDSLNMPFEASVLLTPPKKG